MGRIQKNIDDGSLGVSDGLPEEPSGVKTRKRGRPKRDRVLEAPPTLIDDVAQAVFAALLSRYEFYETVDYAKLAESAYAIADRFIKGKNQWQQSKTAQI